MAITSLGLRWMQKYAIYHNGVELDATDEEVKEYKRLIRQQKLHQMELDTEEDKKEIEKIKGSLLAYHKMVGSSTTQLIEYMATALAYQYKLNDENKKLLYDMYKEQRKNNRKQQ